MKRPWCFSWTQRSLVQSYRVAIFSLVHVRTGNTERNKRGRSLPDPAPVVARWWRGCGSGGRGCLRVWRPGHAWGRGPWRQGPPHRSTGRGSRSRSRTNAAITAGESLSSSHYSARISDTGEARFDVSSDVLEGPSERTTEVFRGRRRGTRVAIFIIGQGSRHMIYIYSRGRVAAAHHDSSPRSLNYLTSHLPTHHSLASVTFTRE